MLGETNEKSKAFIVDEFIKPVIEDKVVIESQLGAIPNKWVCKIICVIASDSVSGACPVRT